MELNGTFYQNVSRTIVGSGNLVFSNDVILLCDTTTASVSLTLAEIPSGSWSTQYKLYVIDKTSNASVNNITINAPVGYTINDQSSLVINTNNGSALISITKDKGYLGQLSTSGGGSALEVLNQGVSITPSANKLDFVGLFASLVAPNSVKVTNAFISVDYATLTTLSNSSSLIPNQWYNVTDAVYGSFNHNFNVYLVALTPNSTSTFGIGEFYNADYQIAGNYSGVAGFVAQLGIWTTSLTPVVGDVCINDNKHYVNISGSNSSVPPSADGGINWKELPYGTKNGYILEYDEIIVNGNNIFSRKDKYNNIVEWSRFNSEISFDVFPFGNQSFQFNKVVNGSFWRSCNSKINQCWWNNLSNTTLIFDTPFFAFQIAQNEFQGSIRPIIFNVGDTGLSVQDNIFSVCQGTSILKDAVVENNNFNQSTIALELSGVSTFSKNQVFASSLSIEKTHGTFSSNTIIQSDLTFTSSSGIEQENVIENSQVNIGDQQGIIRYNRMYDDSVLNITFVSAGGVFIYNTLKAKSSIAITNLLNNFGDGGSKGKGNEFSDCSFIINDFLAGCHSNVMENVRLTIATFNGSIVGCHIYNQSTIEILNMQNNNLIGLTCQEIILGNPTFLLYETYVSGTRIFGVNTIAVTLDCNDPTIYDPITFTLTLPFTLAKFGGKFTLRNANGLLIKKILGVYGLLPYSFYNDNGTTTFQTTGVGVAFVGDLVSNQPAPFNIPIVYRADGSDYIEILRSQFANTITNYYIFV